MNQIFRLNGFDPKDFDTEDEKERMLILLIKQSEEQLGYTSDTKLHASEPKLNLYFYMRNKGITRSEGSSESSGFNATSEVPKAKLFAYMNQLSGREVPVKIEAPEILKLRNMCHVLQAGKGKLQQAWVQVSDTVAELKAKEINHPDVDHAISEVAGLLDKAALFLNELREQLPVMQSHKVDAEMAQTTFQKWKP